MLSLLLMIQTLVLWFCSHPFAHCAAITKDGDEVEEDSLMCRSIFEMHFIFGSKLNLLCGKHSLMFTFSFQMIVISIGKCQHIAERFVVLRA